MPVPRLIHFWPISAFILWSKSSKISSSDDSTSPKSNSGDSLVVDFEHKAYFRFWILCHHTFHRVQTVTMAVRLARINLACLPLFFSFSCGNGGASSFALFHFCRVISFSAILLWRLKTSRVGFIFVLFFPKNFLLLVSEQFPDDSPQVTQ